MLFDIPQTPDAIHFQNIRFINDTISIICFHGNHNIRVNNIDPIEIEKIEIEKALILRFASDYTTFSIYKYQSDEWKFKNEIVLNINIDDTSNKSYVITVKKTHIPSEKNKLVAMTLFKDDAKLIPAYVKYYSKLGIEHFYFYYNGPNVQTMKFPIYDNVTYIEWNYPYALFAQHGAINDFLFWSKNISEYVLYNDLDEFIYWKDNDNTLLEFIENTKYLCYTFRNRFTALQNSRVKIEPGITNYDMIVNGRFEAYNQISDVTHRSKCIVSTKIDVMCIHNVKTPTKEEMKDQWHVFDPSKSAFYHIYNFKDRKRVGNMVV
jgi:hypothetical protein